MIQSAGKIWYFLCEGESWRGVLMAGVIIILIAWTLIGNHFAQKNWLSRENLKKMIKEN